MYLDLFLLHPKPYNIHDLQPSPITFKCYCCNFVFDNKFPLEIVQKIIDYWDNSPMYQSQMPVVCPIEIAVYKWLFGFQIHLFSKRTNATSTTQAKVSKRMISDLQFCYSVMMAHPLSPSGVWMNVDANITTSEVSTTSNSICELTTELVYGNSFRT